jgi:non-specific serine/threonine protein kinase
MNKNSTDKSGAPRATIPTPLTSFVGRERDVAAVERLLDASRLVTLTGAAGCGKTRLALRVIDEAGNRYADGVCWVELAPLADPALVPQAIAKALGVPGQPGIPILDSLLVALQVRHLLLSLDNCEHLLSACAELAEMVLAATEVSILATSREPLGVTGETRYPVPTLALPPHGVPLGQVQQFDSVRLFVERARATLPDFALTEGNAAAVASICHRLDGLPLAIELASAQVNVLTVEQIAARLGDQFDLLGPASHVSYSHHSSLRKAIDWSYDLLLVPEQVLLRRLSVFAGGCSLATVETACTGDGIAREQVLELLSSLVNKSLVVSQTLLRDEARYLLLETIRQYAHEKLLGSGETPAMRDRHLQCFLNLAEEATPKLRGEYQQLWLGWLEGEYDNIRAALAWSLESGRVEAGLRIAVAIYQFWVIHDYAEEGLGWIERLLARADQRVAAVVHANALAYASFLSGFRGRTSAQFDYGQRAMAVAEAAGSEDRAALKWGLAAMAYGARAAGDYETEFELNKREIEVNRELGDKQQLGLSLSTASFSAMALSRYEEARTMLDEAVVLLREVGDRYRVAMALNFSGDLARCERDYKTARNAYEESISILRGIGAIRDLASALHNLGHTCLHLGDVPRAHALFGESMAAQLDQRNTPGVAECLIGFAAMAITNGLQPAGARLLAAAVAIGGERVATAWAATRKEYEHYLAIARAGLTEEELRAEQATGRAYSLEQAVEYALRLPVKAAARATGVLSVREREVAVLIGQGKSNGEIAAELVVSKRTVEKHIANILSRLGLTNRAQIVRWVIEAGPTRAGEPEPSFTDSRVLWAEDKPHRT